MNIPSRNGDNSYPDNWCGCRAAFPGHGHRNHTSVTVRKLRFSLQMSAVLTRYHIQDLYPSLAKFGKEKLSIPGGTVREMKTSSLNLPASHPILTSVKLFQNSRGKLFILKSQGRTCCVFFNDCYKNK